MDLGLNQLQQMLKASARGVLERECPTTLVRDMERDEQGYPDSLWSLIVEQGWLGLVVPESQGGEGGDFTDLCVLLEEMGRFLLPGPFRSTVTEGILPLLEFGSESQRQSVLPLALSGKCIVSLAQLEPSASYEADGIQMTATQADGDYILSGTKLFVRNANVADYFIVPARASNIAGRVESGITCFIVPAGVEGLTIHPLDTMGDDRQGEVSFDGVWVSRDAVLGSSDQGWEVLRRISHYASVAECAWMAGGAEAVLNMTVQFVTQRVQFDKLVGSFQAVQHHCANMAIDLDASRNITYRAAWQLAKGDDAEYETALAKGFVSSAYQRICELAHQCHGAIGFSMEHDLHLYTRRAKTSELAFGNSDVQREALARTFEG
jgi:alkylation response protein AidB-like acyl-CoA dehydrogenase